MSKAVEVAEQVAEEVVEVVEAVERVPRLRLNGTTRKQQLIILSAVALTSAGVAGVVTTLVVRKKLALKYEQLLEQETAQVRAFYHQRAAAMADREKPPIDEVAAPYAATTEALKNAVAAVQRYEGGGVPDERDVTKEAVPPEVTENIFVEGKPMDPDFDYEAEIATRSMERPYIISYEEFQQGEQGYEQGRLTWYDGDDTLTDENDDPIPQSDDVVGDAVRRFGHGSRDPRIVYVRNDVMERDFEVALHDQGYAEAVHGFIKHSDASDSRMRRRRRPTDEG